MNDQPKNFPPQLSYPPRLFGGMTVRKFHGKPPLECWMGSNFQHKNDTHEWVAVQEHTAKITELEQKVKDLEAKAAEVEARIWEEAEREVYFDDKKFRTALQMNHYCAARAKEARSRAAQSTKTEEK